MIPIKVKGQICKDEFAYHAFSVKKYKKVYFYGFGFFSGRMESPENFSSIASLYITINLYLFSNRCHGSHQPTGEGLSVTSYCIARIRCRVEISVWRCVSSVNLGIVHFDASQRGREISPNNAKFACSKSLQQFSKYRENSCSVNINIKKKLQVIGGRRSETGRLGAFVTQVRTGSVADTIGKLRAGEWPWIYVIRYVHILLRKLSVLRKAL